MDAQKTNYFHSKENNQYYHLECKKDIYGGCLSERSVWLEVSYPQAECHKETIMMNTSVRVRVCVRVQEWEGYDDRGPSVVVMPLFSFFLLLCQHLWGLHTRV